MGDSPEESKVSRIWDMAARPSTSDTRASREWKLRIKYHAEAPSSQIIESRLDLWPSCADLFEKKLGDHGRLFPMGFSRGLISRQ